MKNNNKPDYDKEIQAIANYVLSDSVFSATAYETAYYTLLDSIACGIMALNFPACTKVLGPIVAGATLPNGVPIPGLNCTLEPIQAAFNIGTMIRWLDFNDTWLAAEWGHPSDNLGAILALSDYVSRNNLRPTLSIKDILTLMIKAHEIQGVLALENSFNKVGLDHVMLVKIASTAVSCSILQFNFEQTCQAISHAWLDGQSLRTYRHAPNTGPRKSWAAGDASARGVRLALLVQLGEQGYPSAITAKTWGFQDVLFSKQPLIRNQEYQDYVMEHILWKISFPAEFHAQTAVECALLHHTNVKDKLDQVDKIVIETQEAALRIIDKQGPLHNPADRDHCLQYMVAIGLLFGTLSAEHYEDDVAQDPRIDALREKMQVIENTTFSEEYLDPSKRSIGNSIQIYFNDGSETEKISIDYPIGHNRRREEGIPLLMSKFSNAITKYFPENQAMHLIDLCNNQDNFNDIKVTDFMQAWCCDTASITTTVQSE